MKHSKRLFKEIIKQSKPLTKEDFPFTKNEEQDWYIEASRIRCGYNNTSVDLGVKAYIVSEEPNQIIRGNSLIYSGVSASCLRLTSVSR